MKTKTIMFLLVASLVVASTSICGFATPISSERYKCYSGERSGLLIEIEVTPLAWPEENITVQVRAVATQANVHIRFIHINISSLRENWNKTLLKGTTFLSEAHLNLTDSMEKLYNVSVPSDTLPGLLYGEVEYKWSIESSDDVFRELNAFPATYIQNKPFEELKQGYDTLSSLFNDLQANYASLEANFTDLQQEYQQLEGKHIGENSATGLMYLFLVTTGVFVITTILLMVKRPKTTTW